ncbi:MAG: hypothetical protein M3321_07745 [Actinomycetota bacterium]|nr:hypothetical protein [Actinomycetota bacterium]
MRIAAVLAVGGVLALAYPAVATSDVGLIVRRAVVRQGETMTVWGACTYPVYLVREAHVRRLGFYRRYALSVYVPAPPRRPPFRRLGLPTCTGRTHLVGDFPGGDWSSWTAFLRFRVPRVRPGRYQLAVYCAPCRRGRGGSLIVQNHLWRGSKRIGPTALTIRRAA